ncbi:MAG: GrpB family protein [Saprospiraceae bacterium]|nr:GrpB family protein [Saprospiraceae bacterium]MDZ4704736.1 GrpB family protein [Saprospiraceae bacterium]
MLIEKYTQTWIKNFTDLKREIENGLYGLAFNIEHVGSTSVPNLASKPIIDIDIIYSNQADFQKIKSGLEKIGYYHNGNQGIEDRDVFKRNGKFINEILDVVKHHLYVCPIDSKALERHILSRNFLRKNDWARLEYQQMKYELAEKANQDKKKYAELKELNVNYFIDSIIEKEKSERTHRFGNMAAEVLL